MTARQLQVFEFIETYMAKEGVSPSFNDIQEGLGLRSVATVSKHLDALESQGRIRRIKNSRNYAGQRVRSLAICKGTIPDHLLIPHVGCEDGYAVGEVSDVKCSACGKPLELYGAG